MQDIARWIRLRRHRPLVHEESEVTRGPPPLLPLHRPRDITPSPDEAVIVTAHYGLFQRLPYEIRYAVLVAAFGSRTLHLDLRFDYPLVCRSPEPQSSETIGPHCGLGSELVRDTRVPQRWQWFSCVCHRRLEWTEAEAEVMLAQTIKPCDDRCLAATLCTCEGREQLADQASSCFVGVMGWLLACRQAYVEH
jgi:hypothetical protein